MKDYIGKMLAHENLMAWSIVISFCLFLLNSINNIGFYSADEHYQIIEFAAFKQNLVSASGLAWEYGAKERQALQPFIAYCIFEMLDFINISRPFDQIIILRVLNSIFAVFCIYRFVTATLHYFTEKYKPFYIITSFLIWFVPVFYLRFSSETFSQSLLLLACSYLFTEKRNTYALAISGFILGFVFFARFQSAFSMLGLFVGLFISYGYRFKDYVKIALASLLSIFICVLIDFWFYKELVFTPWRYFDYQILRSVAADFGVSPFYEYFVFLNSFLTPVYGLVFLFCFIFPFILREKPNPIYLIVFSTVACLSLVGHKEFRFLLAILSFFPFILVYGIQSISRDSRLVFRIFEKWYTIALLVLVSLSFTVLGILRNNDFLVFKVDALAYMIARDYSQKNVMLFYRDDNCHPFKIATYVNGSGVLNTEPTWLWRNFLVPRHYQDQRVERLTDSRLFIRQKGRTNLLYITKSSFLSSPEHERLIRNGYRLIGASMPEFVDEWISRTPILANRFNYRIIYLFAFN